MRSANILLSFALSLMLSESMGFLRVKNFLQHTRENFSMSLHAEVYKAGSLVRLQDLRVLFQVEEKKKKKKNLSKPGQQQARKHTQGNLSALLIQACRTAPLVLTGANCC